MKKEIAIFWFRRDLRLEDNAGLYHALKSGLEVLPLFIFDQNILQKLNNKYDKRVDFIYQTIFSLKKELEKLGTTLLVKSGFPSDIWKEIFKEYNVKEIYTNHDYEKYALERDEAIKNISNQSGIAFYSFKDQCIFEKKEILSGSNEPYTVFTPYSKKWKATLTEFYVKPYPIEKYVNLFLKIDPFPMLSIEEIGFEKTNIQFQNPELNTKIIANYHKNRDIPSISGTSKLSMHLRFGTISIRKCVQFALKYNETWLNELIWRDFYMNILANFPQINQGLSFKLKYDLINWRNNSEEFEAWCNGRTGFPIVDAGMRELNATGFMHNRVRMIVGSFLCKDLLIDWRWGETYFSEKLLDFDFAANNGGWQWASGSGCDAAPYFRVFNPSEQTKKFDPQLEYIKRWVPEFQDFSYPKPIVNHDFARKRALEVYKEALSVL
ncbi:MAG: deoxyribodipyrimidine photo-lyase [Cytophagaceae bacterium]|nr:deoxyribodipyrimidine photo-lyase [Cytophagaceae bacterium]MBL0326737.1 deoxyribodipyrimidine photo-lyase [Cytophagaceae bacterium]